MKIDTILGFRTDVYRIYDVPLARAIGINPAILIKVFYDKYIHYSKTSSLVAPDDDPNDKNYYYLKIEDLEEITGMAREEQEMAISKLEALHLVRKKVFSVPPKRHFKINIDYLRFLAESLEVIEMSKEKAESVKKLVHKLICGFHTYRFAGTAQIELPLELSDSPREKSTHVLNKVLESKEIRSNNLSVVSLVDDPTNRGDSASPTPPVPPTTSEIILSPSKAKKKAREALPLWKTCQKVKLEPKDYDKLCDKHSVAVIDYYIAKIDRYLVKKKKSYKDYAMEIEDWIDNDKEKGLFNPSGASIASNPGSSVQNKIYKGPADAINASIAKSPHDVPLEQRPNREVYKINSQLYALYKQKGKDMRGFEDDPSLNAKPFTGKVHNYTPPTT